MDLWVRRLSSSCLVVQNAVGDDCLLGCLFRGRWTGRRGGLRDLRRWLVGLLRDAEVRLRSRVFLAGPALRQHGRHLQRPRRQWRTKLSQVDISDSRVAVNGISGCALERLFVTLLHPLPKADSRSPRSPSGPIVWTKAGGGFCVWDRQKRKLAESPRRLPHQSAARGKAASGSRR